MTTPSLSFGEAITCGQEVLVDCTLENIFECVTGRIPSSLESDTRRLRKLMAIDKAAYRKAKTKLPYIAGSVFNGGVRRLDSFLSAHYFILDIDHIELIDGQIPDQIVANPVVAMAFVSPSGEGIKVFCQLETPITDPSLFSALYKQFASEFADKVGLTGSLDLRTHDASRACFLAYDPQAYFNPTPVAIDWQSLEPLNSAPLQADTNPLGEGSASPTTAQNELNEVAYKAILKEINPNALVRRAKDVYVPQDLLEFMDLIPDLCKAANLEISQLNKIQYGVKVCAKQGYRLAELNVFYGKRGFSVIKSPKTGTDPALNSVLYDVIFNYLFPENKTIDIPLIDYLTQSN
ncbi:VirE-like protein [Dyadobacter jejuensis]|uniref:VirE-like protein n=1 Tax=Dyadobacter jejuensis TaxID=1082580 RepID=A0A316AJ91_9BACT|nr:CRISPR-associated primase-polymerase type B [Dyadobacter jejuensis]PWJ57299.1 VirE-like protein [Dyadobacter jejuensis]